VISDENEEDVGVLCVHLTRHLMRTLNNEYVYVLRCGFFRIVFCFLLKIIWKQS